MKHDLRARAQPSSHIRAIALRLRPDPIRWRCPRDPRCRKRKDGTPATRPSTSPADVPDGDADPRFCLRSHATLTHADAWTWRECPGGSDGEIECIFAERLHTSERSVVHARRDRSRDRPNYIQRPSRPIIAPLSLSGQAPRPDTALCSSRRDAAQARAAGGHASGSASLQQYDRDTAVAYTHAPKQHGTHSYRWSDAPTRRLTRHSSSREHRRRRVPCSASCRARRARTCTCGPGTGRAHQGQCASRTAIARARRGRASLLGWPARRVHARASNQASKLTRHAAPSACARDGGGTHLIMCLICRFIVRTKRAMK